MMIYTKVFISDIQCFKLQHLLSSIVLIFFMLSILGCGGGGGGGSSPGTGGGGSPEPATGTIKLGWYPNTESDLAGYRVYYGTSSAGTFSNSIDVGMATREGDLVVYTIPNLIKEESYCIALTAYNTSNYESDFSNPWGDVCGSAW